MPYRTHAFFPYYRSFPFPTPLSPTAGIALYLSMVDSFVHFIYLYHLSVYLPTWPTMIHSNLLPSLLSYLSLYLSFLMFILTSLAW